MSVRPKKLTLKLVRSFTVGFAIHSPTINGLACDIYIGCFHITFWNRGVGSVGFENYWTPARRWTDDGGTTTNRAKGGES